MTLIIEQIFASFLILTGLSYLVQSLVWKDLASSARSPTLCFPKKHPQISVG